MAERLEIIISATDQASKVLQGIGANMKTAAGNASTFTTNIGNAAKQLATYAIGAGLAYKAGQEVVDFFKSSVTGTVDYARSVEDVARFTGMSAEESSKLIQIADDLRISYDQLKMGMKSAVKQGVLPSIEGLKGLAEEYQALPSDLEKSAFALEKFGRAGMEMQKFLELTPGQIDAMSASFEELGLVLDDQAVQQAHDFYLQLDNLNDQWEGIKIGVGTQAIPALSQLLTVFDSLQKAADGADGGVQQLAKDWWDLFTLLSYGAKPTKSAAEIIGDTRRESIDLARANRELGLTVDDNALKFGAFTGVLANLGAEFDPIGAAAGLVNEGIKSLATSIADYQMMLLNTQRIVTGLTDAEYADGLAKVYNLSKLEMLNAGIESGIVDRKEYIGATRDEIITVDELNNAYEGIAAVGLGAVASNSEMAMNGIRDFGAAAEGTLSGLTGSAEAAAGAVGGVQSAINALTSKTVTITVQVNYVEAAGGWKGTAGIWKERQYGGPVTMGMPYLVGEVGPELFVPNTSGRIVPNDQTSSQFSIGNVNIYPASGTNGTQLVDEFMAEIGRRARSARNSGTRFVG